MFRLIITDNLEISGLHDTDFELGYEVKGQPSSGEWIENWGVTLGEISGCICLSVESKVSHGKPAFQG